MLYINISEKKVFIRGVAKAKKIIEKGLIKASREHNVEGS